MVFGAIGAAIIGGALGSRADEKDRILQEQYLDRSLGALGSARGELDSAESFALQDIDAANLLLEGLDEEVLSSLDESMRVAIGHQALRDQEEFEAQDLRLARAGLDSSTVGAGLQRSQRYGQARRQGSLAASFADRRAGALTQVRGLQSQGLFNRAGTVAQFGQARAQTFSQEASILGGVQIAPNNVASSIGALGGSISNAFNQEAMLRALKGDDEED